MFDSVTPRAVTCEAPLSMGLSRQEYGDELPFPISGVTDPGIKPESQAASLPLNHLGSHIIYY